LEHVIDPGRIHHQWDASLEPTLRISPGDTVHFDIKMAGHGQVDNGWGFERTAFDFDTLYNDVEQAARFPPRKGGGNVDTRRLKRGASLLLPVFRDGALFSCGDPHAAQGDGEVCVAAIETDMQATLRLGLHKRSISTPRFVVPGPLTPRSDAGVWNVGFTLPRSVFAP
jgi:acetamidase/formamidase